MITPKQIGTVVMIFMAIVAALSQGGIHLPLGIPETWGPYIQSWSASIMALYLIINPFLPAGVFGPLAPPPNEKVLTKDTAVIAPAGTVVSQESGKASIMKALIALLLIAGAFGFPGHANAKARVTCTPGFLGCPPVHATPVPRPDVNATPVPTPNGPVPAKDIFSGLLTFQTEVVANLQQADTYEAAPLNSASPPTAFNPTAHECLVGMPGQGTAGQPGYVAPSQGLIAWVQGLTPLAGASIPPLPGPTSALCVADQAATPNPASTTLDCTQASPATIAVYADNQAAAALSTVSNITALIGSGNFPGVSDIKQSCGGMLNHVRDEVVTATNDVLAFEALLAKYVMPIVAAHKGPQVAPKP